MAYMSALSVFKWVIARERNDIIGCVLFRPIYSMARPKNVYHVCAYGCYVYCTGEFSRVTLLSFVQLIERIVSIGLPLIDVSKAYIRSTAH
uniref:F-box domain-containing protein n=1 Tax=Parascaris univalens TaxID=6257 RepID=A0A915AT88_PARUN